MSDDIPDGKYGDEKAKFIDTAPNTEVKLNSKLKKGDDDSSLSEDIFIGLSKEEVLQYANDPFWKKIRIGIFVAFWVIWIVMLISAIIIIVQSDKCPPRPKLKWWQKSPVYKVYTPSFKDSNGDGIGDIKGIIEKVDYLSQVRDGALALHVTSIYEGQWKVNATSQPLYQVKGITNHQMISPVFGTEDDFKKLVSKAHAKGVGLKVVLDFFPAYTSSDHPWLTTNKDYYLDEVSPGSNKSCPFADVRTYGGGSRIKTCKTKSGVGYDDSPLCFPLLDVTHKDVQKRLNETLSFWLNLGVDGFVIQDADLLAYSFYLKSGSKCSPDGLADLISKWRTAVGDKREAWYGKDDNRLLMGSFSLNTAPLLKTMFKSDGKKKPTLGVVNFQLAGDSFREKLDSYCNGASVYQEIRQWFDATNQFTSGPLPSFNIFFNDEFTKRFTSCKNAGSKITNAMNALALLSSGTPATYYGDEIGLKQPATKAMGMRSAMQWSQRANGGFGSKAPLMGLGDFVTNNVEMQWAENAGRTNLEIYEELLALRNEMPAFQWGKLTFLPSNSSVLSFLRTPNGLPVYLVAVNFGPASQTVDFFKLAGEKALGGKNGTVALKAGGGDLSHGQVTPLDNIFMPVGSVLVFALKEAPLVDE